MKLIVYTQRVEIVSSYGERRDAADQRLARFIYAAGYLPVPAPNVKGAAQDYVDRLRPAGILLTGGNSLVKYGGDAPERDETDRDFIRIAIARKIPLLGICRGMQSVLDYFSQELEQVEGHVAVRHDIEIGGVKRRVNSYHRQGASRAASPLAVLARAADGVIESVEHRSHRILGVMWHPERESPFCESDLQMARAFFG